jgi:hypothetical protein
VNGHVKKRVDTAFQDDHAIFVVPLTTVKMSLTTSKLRRTSLPYRYRAPVSHFERQDNNFDVQW